SIRAPVLRRKSGSGSSSRSCEAKAVTAGGEADSAWRSRGRSCSRTAGGSGSRERPEAGRRSCSSFRSRAARRCRRSRHRESGAVARAGAYDVTSVLVVDDEPQIRRALRTSLEAHGYEVQTAGHGEEALVGAAEQAPDLVFLDLGLPDIDGTEVIRRLRAFSEVPVIVLSVRDQQADKVAALDAGADDYVTKPFGMEEVLARLRAQLRRAQPEEP